MQENFDERRILDKSKNIYNVGSNALLNLEELNGDHLAEFLCSIQSPDHVIIRHFDDPKVR